MSDDPGDVNARFNLELAEENDRLRSELETAQAQLGRDIHVEITGQDAASWRKFMDYMPQIVNMSTNLAHATSAIQKNEPHLSKMASALTRIADSLEGVEQELVQRRNRAG